MDAGDHSLGINELGHCHKHEIVEWPPLDSEDAVFRESKVIASHVLLASSGCGERVPVSKT